MKLLIAEDDITSRTILTAITRKWGFEPVTVEDGQAAWELLQEAEPPRLLLLDWMMPRLDGLALCRLIRQEKNDNPPYIVILTARTDTKDVVTGLKSGANDFVTKPFDNTELQARLSVGKRMLLLQEKLKQANERLEILATKDALTGLLNRGAIMDLLEQNIARAQRAKQTLCIGLCDIDHFKRINDTHGHPVGDAALREEARRLVATVRPFDQVGRYGGEEFLILADIGRDHAPDLFARMNRVFADAPFVFKQSTMDITISCGVTLYSPPENKRAVEELVADGDAALYEAKKTGRNRTVFSEPRGVRSADPGKPITSSRKDSLGFGNDLTV